MVVFDGIAYEDGETLPDLGSLVNKATGQDRYYNREYMGLSADAEKLPTVSAYPKYAGKIVTGSSFFATDTKELKLYEASSDTWS